MKLLKSKLSKYILLLLLPVFLHSVEYDMKYLKELEKLTTEQKEVLYLAYSAGAEKGYGLTLAAIAWKESQFGKFMLNITDGRHGSYGPFHVLLDYAIIRHNVTSSWGKSRLAEKLVYDMEFSSKEALDVLTYYHDRFKKKDNPWKWAVAAYNNGNKALTTEKGMKYVLDIALRVLTLKDYFTNHRLLIKVVNN
jgi:hypothetical protein